MAARRPGRAQRLSAVVLAAGSRIVRALPDRARRSLDDRVFYAIFNLTRVTNDNYGWRPGSGEDKSPEAAAQGPGAHREQP